MHPRLFSELLASIGEANAIRDGREAAARERVLAVPNLKVARDCLRLTQDDFARLLGVRIKTLQMWEKGRRRPHGPILALCRIILSHPVAALDGLRNTGIGGETSTNAKTVSVDAA